MALDPFARMVKLERRLSSRIAAGLCGMAMFGASIGWLLFCLTTKPGPRAVSGAQAILLLMSLLSLLGLDFARRLLLDAFSGGEIVVGEDALSIIAPRVLRRPIKLDRPAVAGVIVETDVVANADERLRFAVGGGETYLYSSISGSALPILSAERAVPNLAVVFNAPLKFSEARRRVFGGSDFVPLRPLRPSTSAPGLLLRVADPASASQQLAAWIDPERARAALQRQSSTRPQGQRPAGVGGTAPGLLRPLNRAHGTSSIWPSLPMISVVFLLVFLGRHASLTFDHEALLIVALGLMVGGGILDTRLVCQERGGLLRVLSMGLAASGLFIAIAVTALSTYT